MPMLDHYIPAADRYTEIARMLSGHTESDSAKDHARELVDAAAAERGRAG